MLASCSNPWYEGSKGQCLTRHYGGGACSVSPGALLFPVDLLLQELLSAAQAAVSLCFGRDMSPSDESETTGRLASWPLSQSAVQALARLAWLGLRDSENALRATLPPVAAPLVELERGSFSLRVFALCS